ncbi:hypothetical protein FMEXI_10675 [Fusarium mexicanum]|uniref:Uncharacterized protein n=1 Tax=Fusarium mexicanum TaxID=751941 RepID=A0A8H5IG09_9HYPO|nr:hypothetical protein FMEXI_10675 [Fusarium mexicanum]
MSHSGSSGASQPIWDPATQRYYYVINGQSVWANSVQRMDDSSIAENAASVASDYYTSQYAGYQQYPHSWPGTNPVSDTRARLQSGYPTTGFGGFASNSSQSSHPMSQGSAPGPIPDQQDHYRQSLQAATTPQGPPARSNFSQDYNSYKDLDMAAEAAEDFYKRYLAGAMRITKKMRTQNPGMYAGNPLATKEWHQTAARYAYDAMNKLKEAAEAREAMGQDYIGYDTQMGASNHTQRAEILRGKERKMQEKYTQHYYSHSA